MDELIKKLLEEVDPDIKEAMNKLKLINGKDLYPVWQMLPNPPDTILKWQELRDRHGKKAK